MAFFVFTTARRIIDFLMVQECCWFVFVPLILSKEDFRWYGIGLLHIILPLESIELDFRWYRNRELPVILPLGFTKSDFQWYRIWGGLYFYHWNLQNQFFDGIRRSIACLLYHYFYKKAHLNGKKIEEPISCTIGTHKNRFSKVKKLRGLFWVPLESTKIDFQR